MCACCYVAVVLHVPFRCGREANTLLDPLWPQGCNLFVSEEADIARVPAADMWWTQDMVFGGVWVGGWVCVRERVCVRACVRAHPVQLHAHSARVCVCVRAPTVNSQSMLAMHSNTRTPLSLHRLDGRDGGGRDVHADVCVPPVSESAEQRDRVRPCPLRERKGISLQEAPYVWFVRSTCALACGRVCVSARARVRACPLRERQGISL